MQSTQSDAMAEENYLKVYKIHLTSPMMRVLLCTSILALALWYVRSKVTFTLKLNWEANVYTSKD